MSELTLYYFSSCPFCQKVLHYLKENNIEYHNLVKLFKNHPNQLELWVNYDDAHPNNIAHRKIAESILDCIGNRKEK